MSRTVRIILAVFATLLISPCLGFGLFGLVASQEPGTGIGWTIGYIVFELVLIGMIAAGWWAALRRDPRLPWECASCGYDRRGSNDGPCPECGAITG
ncbi:MAG: hypothetical protein ACYTDE_01665 [Planctomycetota bacterium]|jgi:hypothetical protein